jgi:hypothetical protein
VEWQLENLFITSYVKLHVSLRQNASTLKHHDLRLSDTGVAENMQMQ